MRKVVFFDRDGVINDNANYYVYRWDDFYINRGVIEGMRLLKNNGYDFVIISNQSGISKHIYSINDVELLHRLLDQLFKSQGLTVLEYYYCTHHPDETNCLCRKPMPLLFEKAIARFKIDPYQSWMIGDQPRDIEAAEQCRIRGILIPSNADIVTHAVNRILYDKV